VLNLKTAKALGIDVPPMPDIPFGESLHTT
jgi:hypothetical protein